MFTNYNSLRKIAQEDVDIFVKVVQISHLVRNYEAAHPKKRPKYRCHSVCRALAQLMPDLTVADGHYIGARQIRKNKKTIRLATKFYPHSWLVAPKGSIIDPYPVACFSTPLLVVTKGTLGLFGSGLYIRNPGMTPRFGRPKIITEARVLARHIGKLLAKKQRQQSK